MTVTVAHPASVGRVAGRHRYWVYADDDQERHSGIARLLEGSAQRLATPRAFDERAAAMRRPFVDWTDRCLARATNEERLATPFYRNPLDNPLFLHFCWLSLINEHLARGAGDLLVLSESSGLARVVEQLCRHHGAPCVVASRARTALARAWRNGRALAGLAWEILGLAGRMLAARAILGDAHKQKLKGVELLLDSYVLDADLAEDGQFHDRYYPGLLDWYAQRRIRAALFPILYQITIRRLVSVYQRMRLSTTIFVPFELFATMADVVGAAGAVLRLAAAPVRAAPAGPLPVDLQPVAEWHQWVTAARAFAAFVLLRIPERLRAAGIEPAAWIEWYEGQPIDRACHMGLARMGSRCRVTAARHYAPLPNYLSLFTTSAEVESGAAPRHNWVCGSAEQKLLSAFDSAGDYRVVPALRYAHVHRPEPAPKPGKNLLALLPYSRQDAVQVLDCVLPALGSLQQYFDHVVIKTHHTTTARTFASRVPASAGPHEPDKLIWSDAPLHELLPEARVVTTTNTSAALEALCRGRPVIVIGRTAGLTNNPLEEADRRMWRVVYDARELARSVEAWSPEHPLPFTERLALGAALREQYFEPPNEATMLAFLDRAEPHP